MHNLLDGSSLAKCLLADLAGEVRAHRVEVKTPTLAIVCVGDNPASAIYVQQKQKKAAEIGMRCEYFPLKKDVPRETLWETIDILNKRADINGMIVQAPLPSHLVEQESFNRIDPKKDVDGFHAINIGKLCQEDTSGFIPCTPLGIVTLLQHYKIETEGQHVVVVGRSKIVGKPLSLLFLSKGPYGNATVTVAHSKSRHLAQLTQQADILVAATGKPHLITKDMVKPGAVVVDVGINRIPNASAKRGYDIIGDVDFANVAPKTSWITPVPGGVGPLTVALLLTNTFKAYLSQNNIPYAQ